MSMVVRIIIIIFLSDSTPLGEMPIEASNIINIQTKTNNNLVTNTNMEPGETIPTLNLYQNVKGRGGAVFSTNKQDTNILGAFNSPKNKEIINNNQNNGNTLNNIPSKKINLFEFVPKSDSHSLEFYLNNVLKNNKSNFPPIGNGQISTSLFPTADKINGNSNEIPFIVSEHQMPLTDEENISRILKLNDYFQDQTEELINLVINEIIYITIPNEAKIYDINDISNYYYIINKGTVNLVKNKETKKANHIKEEETNIEHKNDKILKTLGSWDSFGELSFFSGKKRNEIVLAQDNVELYAIDSESSLENC